MAISREKKKEILDRLKKIVADATSVVFVNFHGLSVSDATMLRRKLKEEGTDLLVAKKTLVGKTLNESKVSGTIPVLEGELALAFGQDSITPARGIYEFQKKFVDQVSIMGGIFEGSYKDKESMMEIAAISALPVLRGMFVNIINSPIQRLVIALDQIAITKN